MRTRAFLLPTLAACLLLAASAEFCSLAQEPTTARTVTGDYISWLEQVQTPLPTASFTPGRSDDSPEVPLR